MQWKPLAQAALAVARISHASAREGDAASVSAADEEEAAVAMPSVGLFGTKLPQILSERTIFGSPNSVTGAGRRVRLV